MTDSLVAGARVAGDFTLLRPVGRGGSAVVWAARQESTGRVRALKVFAPLAGPHADTGRAARSRQRFVQEARISARIASPHVVEVVAAGVDDDGDTPWMAMELLEGEDLRASLARTGPMPRGEVAALFEQLGAALAVAHRAGVLHLDLKPDNLFLARPRHDHEPFFLKVLDFGIGRMMRELRDAVTVTSAAGSPLWMAPEQAEEGGRVSTATDVWPLGLLAFRALTGRHYWRTGNAEEVSFAAWVLEMMTGELVPARARARALGVEALLPDGFDAWFARCVTRDPSKRASNAEAVARELVALLTGAPQSPPRRRWPWAVAAATGLVALGGAAAAVMSGTGAPRAPATPGDTAALAPGEGSAPGGGGGALSRDADATGTLQGGDTHAWTLAMAPGARATATLTGTTVPGKNREGCDPWSWSWHGPDGARVAGAALPPQAWQRPTEPRAAELALEATAGGTWTLRVAAGRGCHAIRYRLRVR